MRSVATYHGMNCWSASGASCQRRKTMATLESDPRVAADKLQQFGTRVLVALGCQSAIAAEIAEHLVDADLCGVYSHGIFRLDWYAERAAAGKFDAAALPVLGRAEGGGALVDGGNNLGMPAFRLATDHLIDQSERS